MIELRVPCAAPASLHALLVERLGFRDVDGSLARGQLRVRVVEPPALGTCPPVGSETVDVLHQQPGLRLELIHSCACASPPGFWYDQHEAEWVQVLAGAALLRFEDEAGARTLGPGDSAMIEAHRRHRVDATDDAPGTLWLALFWS